MTSIQKKMQKYMVENGANGHTKIDENLRRANGEENRATVDGKQCKD